MKTIKLNINIIFYKRLINLSYESIFRVLSFYVFVYIYICMVYYEYVLFLRQKFQLWNFMKALTIAFFIGNGILLMPRSLWWLQRVFPELRNIKVVPHFMRLQINNPKNRGNIEFSENQNFNVGHINYKNLYDLGIVQPKSEYFDSIREDVEANAEALDLDKEETDILIKNIEGILGDRHDSLDLGFTKHKYGIYTYKPLGNNKNIVWVYPIGSSPNSIRFDDYNTFDKILLKENAPYSPTGKLYLSKAVYVFNLDDEQLSKFIKVVSDTKVLKYYSIDDKVLKDIKNIYYNEDYKIAEAEVPGSLDIVGKYASHLDFDPLLETLNQNKSEYESKDFAETPYKIPRKSNGNGGPEL